MLKKLIHSIPFLFFSVLHSEEAPSEVKHIKNESEASIVLVGGNSKSESYSAKQETSYTADSHKITAKGHYLMGKSGSQISAENWDIGLRYDFAFHEQLGVYVGESISGDRFKNIHLQYDTDAGLKYTFWKAGDSDYALGELGYRLTSYDFVIGQGKTTHYARAYVEAAKSIANNIFGKAWIEYLPNVERTKKYLINFEPSLNVKVTDIFTVKTGFLGKYDSEPTASKKFDYTYTMALIAKY